MDKKPDKKEVKKPDKKPEVKKEKVLVFIENGPDDE